MDRKGGKLPRWTLDEDQALVDLLADYVLKDGLSMNKSMRLIAEELNRTQSSCLFRWHTSIKQHIPEDDKLIISFKNNNPAVIFGGVQGGITNGADKR